MLSADVVFYGDGAATRPPCSSPSPAGPASRGSSRARPVLVNGDPGVLAVDSAGVVVGIMAVQADGGQVVAIRYILNPDKLAHLTQASSAAGPPGTDAPR